MTFNEFLEEWRGQGDIITVKTSGSTGSPKTMILKKEFVRSSGRRTNSFFSLDSSSRLHSCVSADFIGGKMMAVRSELAGCRFTWETPSNRPLSGVEKGESIDLLAVVPSQMVHILDHLDEMPPLGAIIIGGSAIHPDLKRRIAASGLNAFETYGMTETASHIALSKITGDETRFTPLNGIRVATDERGCLVILFDSGEMVVTNDIAEIIEGAGVEEDSVEDGYDKDGREVSFRILGRIDNVIVTGGKKVNPEDLERRIAGLIDADFMITSRPDEKWGERVVLRVASPAISADLLTRLRGVLEPHEMPKEIEYVSSLPLTPNGKLKR